MPASAPSAPSVPERMIHGMDLRAKDVPAVASDSITGRLGERKASGSSTDLPRGFPSVEVEKEPWPHTSLGRGSLNPHFFFFQNQPRQPHPQVSCQPPSGLAHFLVLVSQPALPTLGTTAAVPAPIQAPPVILMLPGQSVDRLCVDIKHSQGPMNLLADPDQGKKYTPSHAPRETQTPLTPNLLPQRQRWDTCPWRHMLSHAGQSQIMA